MKNTFIAEGRRFHTVCLISIMFFVLILGSIGVWKAVTDPDIAFLYSEHSAQWIRSREQTKLMVRWSHKLVTVFRTHFEVGRLPEEAVLHFRAMKVANIWLDGQVILRADSSIVHEWRKKRHIDLTSRLTPGVHELHIAVENQNGHPALIAYCEPLGLFTGDYWEASTDGKTWGKALPVDDTPPLPLSHSFPRADYAFISNMPIYVPIFMTVFLCSLLFVHPRQPSWSVRLKPTARTTRWLLLVLWVFMAINNITKIPLDVGMDIKGHMQYIMYIVDNMRIPLAIEGWQMFQPPLFYIVSAIIYKFFSVFINPAAADYLLRIIPLACGALQVELSYRTLRYVYPERDDLQTIGTVIAGVLPMNIYMAQFSGNESMAACLSSIVILLSLRLFCSPSQASRRDLLSIGLFLGLAILTKATALLIIIPTAILIVYKISAGSQLNKARTAEALKSIVLVLSVIFIISGWYYIRNWIEMGQIIIGGWSLHRDIVWWQDPSYRTLRQFLTFGESLYYPVYSAAISVWDGLYSTLWMDGYLSAYNRPPWNYGFMLSSAWLSLLPSCAIILGILSALIKPNRQYGQGHLYSVSCVIIFISAILYLFLSVPILSTAKATYALGIIPCIAILCTEGFEILTRKPVLRAVVYGGIACWAFAAYASYFVI